MNQLNRLEENYEFIPLEYKNGIVRGIVSPTKIEEYMLDSFHESSTLNPIRYIEYEINTSDINGFLKETGKISSLSELHQYTLDIENPQNIILKDNYKKVEKNYSSKAAVQLDPFIKYNYNLEEKREEKISSSGLGLYLCSSLAKVNNLNLSYYIINDKITVTIYI